MSKSLKITLIVVAAIAAIILLFTAIIGIYSAGLKLNDKTTSFTKKWMSNIIDSTLIKNVVLPGSHDAGTSTLNWLGKTQEADVATQLDMGARYFDLRVKKDGDKLVIFHGPLSGADFEPILRSVKTFLIDNPSETVILDFQHFEGQSHNDVAALIKLVLGSESYKYIVRNTSSTTTDVEFIDKLTLSRCRGKALVFWGSDSDSNLSETYLFKRNDDNGNRIFGCLQSYYQASYNKMGSAKYIAEGLPVYIEKYKNEGHGLFVLQGQLTDGALIFGPKFRERSHRDNMSKYVQDLATSENLKYINIIMRDFVDGEICCEIIKLNLDKNSIKESSKSDFIAGLNEFLKTPVSAAD
ncbi:MAG: phosphatidylinositol-specific phospholipase C domain-containing protein [Corallococcus sp.]|nr:phosphatidylinositol-specific phospholipase C domain-containing protein [Corallococcus sp.]